MTPHSPSGAVAYDPDGLGKWFMRIETEIAKMRALSFEKEGIFFQKHKYSAAQLKEHPIYDRISSFIGKVHDIVVNWQTNSSITEDRLKFYYAKKAEVERALNEVKSDIILRKPTFYERIQDFLDDILRFIEVRLPHINKLLENVGLPQIELMTIKWAQKRVGSQRRPELKGKTMDELWDDA